MTTDETLNAYARVLGVRLESILLETERADGFISARTYETQRYALRQRLDDIAGVSKPPVVEYVLWKDGASISVPPGDVGRLETGQGDV